MMFQAIHYWDEILSFRHLYTSLHYLALAQRIKRNQMVANVASSRFLVKSAQAQPKFLVLPLSSQNAILHWLTRVPSVRIDSLR